MSKAGCVTSQGHIRLLIDDTGLDHGYGNFNLSVLSI